MTGLQKHHRQHKHTTTWCGRQSLQGLMRGWQLWWTVKVEVTNTIWSSWQSADALLFVQHFYFRKVSLVLFEASPLAYHDPTELPNLTQTLTQCLHIQLLTWMKGNRRPTAKLESQFTVPAIMKAAGRYDCSNSSPVRMKGMPPDREGRWLTVSYNKPNDRNKQLDSEHLPVFTGHIKWGVIPHFYF